MAKRTPRAQANDSAGMTQEQPQRSNMKLVESNPRDTESRSMGSEPSEEDIRQRAYERYLERGGGHGMDFEDWLEAERELKSQK